MATQTNAKDFSLSAEKLTNPDEVKSILIALHNTKLELEGLEFKLEQENKELVAAMRVKKSEIDALLLDLKGDPKNNIVGAIEKYGSYQDTENQHYAVRYRSMIKTYHVEPFKERFRKYVDAVVVETINVKALEGLIKGKLIDVDELKADSRVGLGPVLTETPQYSYYVR